MTVLFLVFGGPLFAQTDYFFVLEKPAPQSVSTTVFQVLVSALVTDNDTAGAVSCGDNASLLFAPLSGGTPNLAELAAAKLHSDPLKGAGAVSAAGVSSSIALANEQAAAWGRPDVEQKLIVITGPASKGKARNIIAPDAFSAVYYLSLDAPPEQALADLAGPDHFWGLDSVTPEPSDPAFLPLEDGVFACIQAIIPQYKKAAIGSDLATFSAGNLFWQARKAVALAVNTSPDPVGLLNAGNTPGLSIFPQPNYTVLLLENRGGTYTVENGEILLAAVWGEFSLVVFVVLGLAAAALALVILAAAAVAAKRIGKQTATVFVVSYEINDRASGLPNAEICKKKKRKKEGVFESGDSLKTIMAYIGVEEAKLDPRVTGDGYPHIEWDREKDAWFVQYNPNTASAAANREETAPTADDDFDPFDNPQPSSRSSQNEYTSEEEDMPLEDQIQGNRFVVKRIFRNSEENKLVLTRA